MIPGTVLIVELLSRQNRVLSAEELESLENFKGLLLDALEYDIENQLSNKKQQAEISEFLKEINSLIEENISRKKE